jgi:tRNA threonylcarbamoyladenosine biosynthesis protein TsaE
MDVIRLISKNPEQTRAIAETIGRRLLSKTVISLSGDLGAGKTVFVQGLARGLEVPGSWPVTSPTYTLVNAYPGRIPLMHADLYRLSGPMDFEEIGGLRPGSRKRRYGRGMGRSPAGRRSGGGYGHPYRHHG